MVYFLTSIFLLLIIKSEFAPCFILILLDSFVRDERLLLSKTTLWIVFLWLTIPERDPRWFNFSVYAHVYLSRVLRKVYKMFLILFFILAVWQVFILYFNVVKTNCSLGVQFSLDGNIIFIFSSRYGFTLVSDILLWNPMYLQKY